MVRVLISLVSSLHSFYREQSRDSFFRTSSTDCDYKENHSLHNGIFQFVQNFEMLQQNSVDFTARARSWKTQIAYNLYEASTKL